MGIGLEVTVSLFYAFFGLFVWLLGCGVARLGYCLLVGFLVVCLVVCLSHYYSFKNRRASYCTKIEASIHIILKCSKT